MKKLLILGTIQDALESFPWILRKLHFRELQDYWGFTLHDGWKDNNASTQILYEGYHKIRVLEFLNDYTYTSVWKPKEHSIYT